MFLLNESCHTCKMNLHSFTWSLRLELHIYWLVYCLCCAGDARVNVVPSLGWSHALFLREHNRIAKIFANINPRWSDETIFQETRRLVAAIIQVQLHFNSTSSFLLHLLFLHLFIVLPFILHLPQSPCFCFYLRSHLSILSDEGRHLPQSPCFCFYLRSHLSTISDEGRHLPQSPFFLFLFAFTHVYNIGRRTSSSSVSLLLFLFAFTHVYNIIWKTPLSSVFLFVFLFAFTHVYNIRWRTSSSSVSLLLFLFTFTHVYNIRWRTSSSSVSLLLFLFTFTHVYNIRWRTSSSSSLPSCRTVLYVFSLILMLPVALLSVDIAVVFSQLNSNKLRVLGILT